MAFILPDFSESSLDSLSACGMFADESIYSEVSEKPFEGDFKYEGDHWLRVLVNPARKSAEPHRVHLHIDSKRSFGSTKPPPSTTQDEALAFVERFYGKTGNCSIWAKFVIPEDRRPNSGLVGAMLGVSLVAGDGKLSMTGARMQYSGKVLDEIEWRLRDDKSIQVMIEATADLEVQDDYLVRAYEVLKPSLDQFILSEGRGSDSSQSAP